MEINNETVTAEVYIAKKEEQKFYVKLHFHKAYVCGITVMPSLRNPGEMMVNMPSYSIFGKWRKYIEFQQSSPLKKLFEGKALDVVINHPDYAGKRTDI